MYLFFTPPGCLISILVAIALCILMVFGLESSEAKDRDVRKNEIISSVVINENNEVITRDDFRTVEAETDEAGETESSEPNEAEENGNDSKNLAQEMAAASADGLYYKLYDDHVSVTGLADFSRRRIEPAAEVGGLPVTEIAEKAFENELIEEVVLSENINIIGKAAFRDCEALRIINIPYGVKEIPSDTFFSCESLKHIELPETVEIIGGSAFSRTKIDELDLSLVKKIGRSALSSTNLRKIDLSSAETIEESAFSYCDELEEVILPNTVKELPRSTFAYCKKLRSITVPEGVKTIGKYCFDHCEALSEVSLPNSLTEIEDYCFEDCKALKELTIPENVVRLRGYTFSYAENLERLYIPAECKIPKRSDPFDHCYARLVFY